MSNSIANQIFLNSTDALISQVFPSGRKVFRDASREIFRGIVLSGSTVITNIAKQLPPSNTSLKGCKEKISGWLNNYDFTSHIQKYVEEKALEKIDKDTIIAIDSSDISKEFGGCGMEGMENGWDASRKTTAMGHNLLAAIAVVPNRAYPISVNLLKGRHNLPKAETQLIDQLMKKSDNRGIFVLDRGFDSQERLLQFGHSTQRAVIRMKSHDRDPFGSGKNVEKELKTVPKITAQLNSPTRSIKADIRWKQGVLQLGDENVPVLIVSSTYNEKPIYLYALNFTSSTPSLNDLKKAAILAAKAYFCRWTIEIFFQDVKEMFTLESARVRTFKRLQNLLAFTILGYFYFAHFFLTLPKELQRLNKLMRENIGKITTTFRPFVVNVRELFSSKQHLRFITGRPKKKKAPEYTQILPGFNHLFDPS